MLRAVLKLSYCNLLKLKPQRQVTKLEQNVVPIVLFHSRANIDSDDERNNLPRITCPKKLKEHYEHRLKKFRQGKINPVSRGPLIIECKRKIYNFRKHDRFDKFNPQKLVSCGWKNKKHAGDHFTLIKHSENPSLQRNDETSLSFQELGINEHLCTGLQTLGFEQPTEIQKRAIPSLLRGENAICAAETGSGKTLAYLLPAVEWILRLKRANDSKKPDEGGNLSNISEPNTVVLTPNRELAHQITGVAETLRPYADFVPCCLTAGYPRVKLPASMDLLVTTPGVLIKHLSRKRIKCTNLQRLIIDESDTLFDDSFISDLHKIFGLLQVSPVENVDSTIPYLAGTQVVLFSATMPRNAEEALEKFIPVDLMNRITTSGLHKLQPHVTQKFVRVKPSAKPEKLIQVVKEKQLTTLIFANSSKTCYYLSKILEENRVDCLRLSSELTPENRAGVFNKFKEGYSNVLVATDIMSRGLDTTNVQHVINYDFPTFMSDYIHRVGRVGRVGVKETGLVTSFISHKYDVDLLWKIEAAARGNTKLHNVNANIKKVLQGSKPTEDFE